MGSMARGRGPSPKPDAGAAFRCYIDCMATRMRPDRRTTTVPVTTMEEVPVLDDRERNELVASLRRAEAEIEDGKGVDHEPERFRSRLRRIFGGGRG